jgi:hypothetical protein
VAGREAGPELAALGVEVDHDLGEELRLPEDLVQQQPHPGDLVVVDAHEHRAAGHEQCPHRLQAGAQGRHPLLVRGGAVAVGQRAAGVVRRVEVGHVEAGALTGQLPQHREVVAHGEGVPGAHAATVRRRPAATRDPA